MVRFTSIPLKLNLTPFFRWLGVACRGFGDDGGGAKKQAGDTASKRMTRKSGSDCK